MLKIKNIFENPNICDIENARGIHVLEYKRDISTSKEAASTEYFASKMNVRKRQVFIELNNNAFVISAGAMQWTAGNVKMSADVKGVGDLIGKALSSKVTKESAIKPKYEGTGYLMLEPTYKNILIEDVSEWGEIVLDDGLFLACESQVKQSVEARSNISSALMGGEGFFNLKLSGNGLAVLESPVPRNELIEFELNNDEVRIDGNYAIAWSSSLEFRVEKASKSIIGSGVSGEGFVNVYKGTGRILMSPVR